MAKKKNNYVCGECGYKSSKWLGKCPECNSWDSFEEEIEMIGQSGIKAEKAVSYKLDELKVSNNYRYLSNFGEFDRVLGGGLVKGAVALLSGSPGVGKSTLLLQLLDNYAKHGKVLYVTGEESLEQVKSRSGRLKVKNSDIHVVSETELEKVEAFIKEEKPQTNKLAMNTTDFNCSRTIFFAKGLFLIDPAMRGDIL